MMLASTSVSAVDASAPNPRLGLAVLTCMDARLDPCKILGLELGDAHIIRNAGGLVTSDAIRSLSASQRLLGTTKISVVMHEGCGLQSTSDDEFVKLLEADGATPEWRLGAFDDLDATLRDGLSRLRASRELAARDDVRGFVFNLETGVLRECGS
jgi:carbonic anhydrase